MSVFDEMVRDAFDPAFEEMRKPVEYRADRDGEFIPADAIPQGERGADDYTENGAERVRTRVFSFITDPNSTYCVSAPIVKHATILHEGIAYTITDIESKPGVVDVLTLHAGVWELAKEGWRK